MTKLPRECGSQALRASQADDFGQMNEIVMESPGLVPEQPRHRAAASSAAGRIPGSRRPDPGRVALEAEVNRVRPYVQRNIEARAWLVTGFWVVQA